jgi:outer membrane protein
MMLENIFIDQLYSMINESYSQMKISTELTKEFLNTSKDLKIKQTDYLNIKLLTSLTHSALLKIELNKKC